MTTKEFLQIAKWFDEGVLEYRHGAKGWTAQTKHILFDQDYEFSWYRRKLDGPKLRAWKPEEVPVGAEVKTKDGKVRGLITGVGAYGVVIGNSPNAFVCQKILDEFTMKDGSPCGVMEGGL